MKKLLLTLILGIFFLSLASAEVQTINPIKQNECGILIQTCDNCTFVNITKVIRSGENSTIFNINDVMTKDGTFYNYSFCNTNIIGKYIYSTVGDLDGITTNGNVNFEVTPSGQSGTANIVFFVFIILLLYGITFAGFFGRNIPITILGGMVMMFLGVYIINNGIIIFRDTLTNYVAYITIAVGFITTSWAFLEQFDVI